MPTSLSSARSLIATFTGLYHTDPSRCLFVFVDEHGNDAARLTVGDLAGRADEIRNFLSGKGIKAGDRVLLIHLPSPDFVEAFLGCLAAGVLPVPVAPPNPFTLQHDLTAVSAIADRCGARAILTHQDYRAVLDAAELGRTLASSGLSDLPWLVPDRDGARANGSGPDLELWHQPASLDDPAYLQHTSGTTGPPKTVVVSHRNVHHELDSLAHDVDLGPETTAVTWVPHYHDLGLVCFLLNTLAGNTGRTYLISALHFLQRPAIWFDVISRVRGTHTSGPDFAYDLVCRRTTEQQRAGWDLSSVRSVGSGGEIVRSGTLERFFATFASTGLDPTTFHPGYGLAEHTMSLSMGTGGPLALDRDELARGRVVPARPDSARDPIVCYGCGWLTKPDTSLRIVDPETHQPCAPDEVGEIWIDSPTKALGYWGREQETRDTFQAEVGDGDPRRYLRTGDMGFLWAGELYVTGRLKDMIIIRGHTYYPEDIEEAVRDCHPRIRRGGVAAFSVSPQNGDAEQRLVVLTETSGDAGDPELADTIRRAVGTRVHDAFGIACHEVVVGQKLVRKTTSGKVRRTACREEFLRRHGETSGDGAITNTPTAPVLTVSS